MRNETLSIAFFISLAVHLSAIMVGAVVVHESHVPTQELLRVSLIDMPRREPPPPQKIDAPAQRTNPLSPPHSKLDHPKQRATPVEARIATTEPKPAPLPSAPAKEEPAKTATSPNIGSTSRVEGGGSEAGIGNFFGKGDFSVTPGPGTSGGGGGTAASGPGYGAGAPGLAAQSVLRTNREAKPIQTVRAGYPPMALRAGLESDVTLRVIVDADGNVTHAEITKSGGAGFDEEALKAVKQSRFEPAQKNGQNVVAEFSYVFRFRIQR